MLRQRLLTALVLIPLTVWAVLGLSGGALALLLAMFVLLGAWEWAVLMGLNSRAARTVYLGLVLLALWIAWSLIGRPGVFIGLLLLALAWWITASYFPEPAPFIRLVVGGSTLGAAYLLLLNIGNFMNGLAVAGKR